MVAWPGATPVTFPFTESTLATAGAEDRQRNMAASCSRPPQVVSTIAVDRFCPTVMVALDGNTAALISEVQLLGPQPYSIGPSNKAQASHRDAARPGLMT